MSVSSLVAFSVLGLLCSVFYDVFYLLQKLFSNKKATFVLDVLFSIFCGFLSLLFVIAYNNGEVRALLFLAFVVSFYVYRFTFGRLSSAFIVNLSNRLRNIFAKIVLCLENVKKRLQKCSRKVYNKSVGHKKIKVALKTKKGCKKC